MPTNFVCYFELSFTNHFLLKERHSCMADWSVAWKCPLITVSVNHIFHCIFNFISRFIYICYLSHTSYFKANSWGLIMNLNKGCKQMKNCFNRKSIASLLSRSVDKANINPHVNSMHSGLFLCDPILTIKLSNVSWKCSLSYSVWIIHVCKVLNTKNGSFWNHVFLLAFSFDYPSDQ